MARATAADTTCSGLRFSGGRVERRRGHRVTATASGQRRSALASTRKPKMLLLTAAGSSPAPRCRRGSVRPAAGRRPVTVVGSLGRALGSRPTRRRLLSHRRAAGGPRHGLRLMIKARPRVLVSPSVAGASPTATTARRVCGRRHGRRLTPRWSAAPQQNGCSTQSPAADGRKRAPTGGLTAGRRTPPAARGAKRRSGAP